MNASRDGRSRNNKQEFQIICLNWDARVPKALGGLFIGHCYCLVQLCSLLCNQVFFVYCSHSLSLLSYLRFILADTLLYHKYERTSIAIIMWLDRRRENRANSVEKSVAEEMKPPEIWLLLSAYIQWIIKQCLKDSRLHSKGTISRCLLWTNRSSRQKFWVGTDPQNNGAGSKSVANPHVRSTYFPQVTILIGWGSFQEICLCHSLMCIIFWVTLGQSCTTCVHVSCGISSLTTGGFLI